jgi:hypothetical protein
VEVTPVEARELDVDVVVLQRPQELQALAAQWLHRQPGRDVPAVYVEHNAPQGLVNEMRHPLARRDDIVLAHVTHFNDLFWDAGCAPTTVIEHGIVPPAAEYTGELPRASVVVNEPVRRFRVTGTDLLPRLRAAAPLDIFGMDTAALGGRNLTQRAAHEQVAQRRAYVHTCRWTSLGLSLLEAMQIGAPPVALATTEVREALPPGSEHVSTSVDRCCASLRTLIADPEAAIAAGKACREWAYERFGLDRFLADWDRLFAEVTR